VAPAAHYMIGGVRIDLDGRTSLPGRYASGECSCSGLHGANRLASNSLLEGLVFSRRIVRALESDTQPMPPARVVSPPSDDSVMYTLPVAVTNLQELMSSFVGVNRSEGSLEEASMMLGEMAAVLDVSLTRPAELELQNLVTLATLLTHAAWYRTESRGCHSRTDFPLRDDENWRVRTVWKRGASPRKEPVAGRTDAWAKGVRP